MQMLGVFTSDLTRQLQVLDQLKSQIDQIWFHADELDLKTKKKLSSCADLKIEQLEPDFLKCNDLLLKCFLQQSLGDLQRNSISIIQHPSGDPFHLLSAAQMYSSHFKQVDGLKIQFALNSHKMEHLALVLERNCHEKKLPEKIYKISIKPEWRWDNFGREIMLDKYLTNQMLISQWSKHTKLNLDHLDLSRPAMTAVGLSLAEQRRFCEFRGGKVIDLPTYEAMIFYPTSWEDPALKTIKLYPYPWGRSERVNPFKNASAPDSSDCSLVFSKNCKNRFVYNPWETNNISWMGTYQILGGPLEAIENPFGQSLVKLSSYYFLHSSSRQKNAEYAFWNGKPFKQLRLFPVKMDGRVQQADRIDENKMWDIGFRCIREY
jgi:hypothetical protein